MIIYPFVASRTNVWEGLLEISPNLKQFRYKASRECAGRSPLFGGLLKERKSDKLPSQLVVCMTVKENFVKANSRKTEMSCRYSPFQLTLRPRRSGFLFGSFA